MSTEYLESIARYTLANGIVTLTDPPEMTDNAYLYTATDFYMRKRLGLYEAVPFLAVVNYWSERARNRKWPLPEKSWGHGNLSHDEINGLACVGFAEIVFDIAGPLFIVNATGNFLDNFRGCYLRFPYLTAFVKVMAGHEPCALEQRAYAWDLKRATKARYKEPGIETSKRCLLVLQSQWVERFPPRMKDAMYDFMLKTDQQFGGLGGLYGVYFKSSHPFATHSQGLSIYPRAREMVGLTSTANPSD